MLSRLTKDDIHALIGATVYYHSFYLRMARAPGAEECDLVSPDQLEAGAAYIRKLTIKLRTIWANSDTPTPCETCDGLEAENASLKTKLTNIRQVCEDTPREPGDMESADIPSALLDVLTGALDEIQEEAT